MQNRPGARGISCCTSRAPSRPWRRSPAWWAPWQTRTPGRSPPRSCTPRPAGRSGWGRPGRGCVAPRLWSPGPCSPAASPPPSWCSNQRWSFEPILIRLYSTKVDDECDVLVYNFRVKVLDSFFELNVFLILSNSLFIIFPQTLHMSEHFLSPVFPWRQSLSFVYQEFSGWPQRQSGKENIHIPFSLQLLEAIALLAMVSVVILRVEKSWHRVCNLQLTILYSTFIYNWEKALGVREWHNKMTRDETHNFSVIRAQLRHSQFTVSRRGLSQ